MYESSEPGSDERIELTPILRLNSKSEQSVKKGFILPDRKGLVVVL